MTEPSDRASVQLARGAAVRVALGDTVRLSASTLPIHGEKPVVHWTSADPMVARVNASGRVLALAVGSTTVTAMFDTGASAVVIVTVGPVRKVDDRAALTALYEATDGPNWIESEGWLTDAPLGDWYGIWTDDQGRVTAIQLYKNGLVGEIPVELSKLGNLEGVNLGNNRLTGEIPAELGNLANLRSLDLELNGLTGEIPAELGGLAKLESVDLRGNDLTGEIPAVLGDLTNLRNLSLSNNDLADEIPAKLDNLANLEVLELDLNDLTGEVPGELGGLVNLRHLGLSNNGLTGEIPAELGGLAKLERLGLNDNDLTGSIPAELGRLANLRVLELSSNDLTGEIPADLGGLVKLAQLTLRYNDLTGSIPAELGNLANLRELSLYANDLTGEVPEELGQLANLYHLDLSYNLLTGTLPARLADLVHLVKLLWWGQDGLCAPSTRRFIDFANELQEHGGSFCHEADVSVLESLYELADGPTWKSSDGWLQPGPLSEWHGVATDSTGRVVKLDLSGNGLSGALPGSLASMDALRELRVGDNTRLGGRIALGMTALPLRNLQYDATNLCTPAEPSFRSWLRAIPSHTSNGVECPPLTDREVLEVLYRSSDGPNWRNGDNWMTDAPLEAWYGVRTDEQGRVLSLSLARNNLAGEIPVELTSLVNLLSLDLSENDLTGKIPAKMDNLSNLHSLALKYNRLTGEIPVKLGDLVNLLSLDLSFNDLTGEIPIELGNLGNLDSLSLRGNDLTGEIPVEVGNLVNLLFVDLSFNSLTGDIPAALGHLASVETLRLSGNDLKGKIPAALGNLINLVELSLYINNLTGIPAELGNLTNLRSLILERNDLTGEIPAELGNLTNLRSLILERNDLTGEIPAELGNLTNLRSLILERNDLTGEIPAELGNLASLGSLNLRNNGLTGEIPAELGNLGNLRWLGLEKNKLTGGIPAELGNLIGLGWLGLDDNAGMSGALPSELTAFRPRELWLGGTGLCAGRDDAAVQSWLKSIWRRRVRTCRLQGGRSGTATAYVVQAVQSAAFPVPLVAGKPGLLRVFVSVPGARTIRVPAARATFHQADGSAWTVEVPSGNGAVPAVVAEHSLSASANVEVPGTVLRPGVEMVVEVDPDGVLDPALGVPRRIPTTGRTALDVYEMPSFDVTVVPFLWEADPDSSILDVTRGMTPDDPLFEETRRLLPVGAMSVTVHEPVWTSSNNAIDLYYETEAIRSMESGDGYWMGTLPGPIGASGVARVQGKTSFSRPSPGVIAHEFGHNMSLEHAPCGATHPSSRDPSYPERRGGIGAWGWDRRSGRLVSPGRKDLMSYCDPTWIGDYHFANALRWRMHDEARVGAYAGRSTRVLLLWGGTDADDKPFLNPAFVVHARPSLPEQAGEWRIVGEANDGHALFDWMFDMAATADGDGRSSFVLTIPAEPDWANVLARIVLTGPGGSMEMGASAFPAVALLLDTGTGRVRGILRDWSEPGAQPDMSRALPEPGLEDQVSRGVPAPEAWRR